MRVRAAPLRWAALRWVAWAVASPSAWVPGSKPIWFTELGAPAVDGAANQPNVFPDPKSSENAMPYHSRGGRDDLAQRRFLEAHLGHWAAQTNGMVPTDRIYLWTWDARPQPAFPAQQNVWTDGGNWHLGHWLTGRLGGVAADDLMHALAADGGLSGVDATRADGVIDGLLLDGDHTARSVIEALSDLWSLSITQSGDALCVASADWSLPPRPIGSDDMVEAGEDVVLAHERVDDAELPGRLDLSFADVFSSYEAASVSAFRGDAGVGTENVSLSVSLSEGMAQSHASDLLRSRWATRDSVSFALPPAWEDLAAGDPILVDGREYAVAEIERGEAISISARSVDRLALRPAVQEAVTIAKVLPPASGGAPDVNLLDLPRLPGTTASVFGAVSIKRWRGSFGLYASAGTDGFSRRAIASRNAVCGRLTSALPPGTAWRWASQVRLVVELVQGELSSQTTVDILNGANVAAIETSTGWELVQFRSATLIGDNLYELSGLLRGQNGTETQMGQGAVAGARFVLLDDALVSLNLEDAERGVDLNWRALGSGDLASSPNAVSAQFAGGIRGLEPLSPVHLRLSNNIFSWTRRDRLDADNWDQLDVPMSERTESYLVRIADGSTGTIVHQATVSETLFDASGLAALPPNVQLEVAQISAITGPGAFASRTFTH
ncbi:MAG: glycoside hydrolase TIM-barrel-like domain-containing protein [Pseudomonadota bacterium]